MFAVSLNWICEILDVDISLDEIMNIFNLQGFEVKEIEEISNDHIITIEVKANRPDMLSHYGVARELASFMNIRFPNIESNICMDKNDKNKINVLIDESICDSFCVIRIDGINNKVETPNYIKERLALFNINSINPIVDISNYIAIEFGQPTHAYDVDKISGNLLNVHVNDKAREFISLDRSSLIIEKGDIVISDKSKILNIAGIIGSSSCEIESSSQNIVIESASFAKIPIRLSSRRLKVSSLASFRFERGVDPLNSYNVNKIFADTILKICGGKITYHYEYLSDKLQRDSVNLRVDRVNSVLGTLLNANEICSSLNKYSFKCEKKDEKNVIVSIPSFRLDIEGEIDLVEEVSRSIGYDNIEPKRLNIISNYVPNLTHERSDVIRDILNGFGFNEVINYSFIHEKMQKILGINEDKCIFLQNPLSNFYSLMRPNLLYSLLYSSSYNYSIGNYNISLYEIGRSYIKDKDFARENNKLAFIISGNRLQSGFNIQKNIKFDFYDMTSYLKSIFNFFNMEYDFKQLKCGFLKNSYDIIFNDKSIGFLGEVCKNEFLNILPNIKLIKDDMFYCEINIDSIKERRKFQTFDSKFPSVVRMYNFICNKNTPIKDIIETIKKCGEEVNRVSINDVYTKGVSDDNHAILFEVCFWVSDRTLNMDEVECLEEKILRTLYSLYGIKIKEK